MNFYGWDLGFVMPIHYVEMYLANGCLFESEDQINPSKELAQQISSKSYDILN